MDPRPLSNAEKIARLRLIRTDSIGPITFRHLIARYGSAEDAVRAVPALSKGGGRKKPLRIPPTSEIESELQALERMGGAALFLGDTAYPVALAATDDAPPVLFAKGNLHLLQNDMIGIVGARNASSPGITITKRLAADLSEAEIVVVSGMARGIDTAAHWAALPGGTVACLAGGLDIIYPRENDRLYDALCEQGVIVSEMPLSTRPQARHFPRRNRIISGLSLGTLVVEATEKSGSLITARIAGEQGRDVFAVPGSPLDPRSAGTNRLIREGAKLTTSAQDIVEELSVLRSRTFDDPHGLPLFDAASDTGTPSEKARSAIQTLLGPTPVQIDELIRQAGVEPREVLTIILELELADAAVRYPGGRISLKY